MRTDSGSRPPSSRHLERPDLEDGSPYQVGTAVHVLVSGDYSLTLHEAGSSLPELLAPSLPGGPQRGVRR